MAMDVMEIVDIPDTAVDDEEISVIYSTPVSIKKGTSKFDAIPVEHYRRRRKPVMMIDLSQDSFFDYDDDDVKILPSIPQTRKFFYNGECSNSKESPVSKIHLLFMCEICADEKPVSDAFRVLGCTHSYCTECITKYVASKLQDNITTINCPVSDCKGYFEPQHCRFILPKEVFDRWGDALCEAVILGSEKFYCPYKNCSALLIDDRSGSNEVILQSECPECNRLFCVKCKVPWHSGIECSEFQKLTMDERSNEDIMLMNLAKSSKWMRCPKCKIYVSKTEGCLYMRCRCGFTFCYNCGAPMAEHLHYCRVCKH